MKVCGTYQAASVPAVFPIDIIEAADAGQALASGATAAVEPHSETLPRPVYKTDLEPCRDDEIEFVCDIDLGPKA